MLCDHLSLLHPEQPAHQEHKQPVLKVGYLVEKLRIDTLLGVIHIIHIVVEFENPKVEFDHRAVDLEDHRPIREFSKHMVSRDLGRQAPTASLKYKLPEYCALVHQKLESLV